MKNLWLPGVSALPSSGGGSMAGGSAAKALWHRTVGGTFASNATYLAHIGNEPHILWDPRTGELGQFIAADRSSKALKNAKGGVETNRVGRLCVQIEVVDRGDTFVITDTAMLGGDRLMTWLRSLGIPDVMPGGPFPPLGFTAHVSSQVWNTASGHFSHSQAPENDHTDPGLMDPARLFALGQTVTAQQVPPPPVQEDIDMPLNDEDKAWLQKSLSDYTLAAVRGEGVSGAGQLGRENAARLVALTEAVQVLATAQGADPAVIADRVTAAITAKLDALTFTLESK